MTMQTKGSIQPPSGRANVVYLDHQREARTRKAQRLAEAAERWMEIADVFLPDPEQAETWAKLSRGAKLREMARTLAIAGEDVMEQLRQLAGVHRASDGSGAVSDPARYEMIAILRRRAEMADELDAMVAAHRAAR
jgi:hypothetical protein